jgi:hypothetical protein
VGGCCFCIPNPLKTLTTPPREPGAILLLCRAGMGGQTVAGRRSAAAPEAAATTLATALLLALLQLGAPRQVSGGAAINVLFIVCDDLRTQLKTYGHADYMATPHIDALAAESLVFERAYTNYPYCAPSRNSFMSGRMPSKTRAWNFLDHFREVREVREVPQGTAMGSSSIMRAASGVVRWACRRG